MAVSNISSNAIRLIVTKFHIEPPWAEGKQSRSHNQHGRHAYSWQKPLKCFFSGTSGPTALKFDM